MVPATEYRAMIAPSAREAPMAFGVTPGQGASTAAEIALLERTRAYLAAIEQDTDVAANPAPGGALAFYHPATNEALPPLGDTRRFLAWQVRRAERMVGVPASVSPRH
jgi:hypothetical protein